MATALTIRKSDDNAGIDGPSPGKFCSSLSIMFCNLQHHLVILLPNTGGSTKPAKSMPDKIWRLTVLVHRVTAVLPTPSCPHFPIKNKYQYRSVTLPCCHFSLENPTTSVHLFLRNTNQNANRIFQARPGHPFASKGKNQARQWRFGPPPMSCDGSAALTTIIRRPKSVSRFLLAFARGGAYGLPLTVMSLVAAFANKIIQA
ncbi:MAG: hypothetical protein IPM39_01170 [Chloroflexi bacterium]|nr:hypothetical protein [Chloroflexota bacterium]